MEVNDDGAVAEEVIAQTAESAENPAGDAARQLAGSDPAAEVTRRIIQVENLTDLGNAKRFAAMYRHQVRYCAAFSKWLIWDGSRWVEDRRLQVYDMAAAVVRETATFTSRIQDQDQRKAFLKHVTKSESHMGLTAMLKLAMADPRIAVVPENLDRDPWLLNVQNGTLNLRSGVLQDHNPRDLLTKLAPVEFDATATSPNWAAFLGMILENRTSVIEFLKRACGSCLTGITSDKAMYILWGPGGDNGKSTMVDVIQSMLGDFGVRTPIETFANRKEGSIPNDIARLKGARFVWSSENERGSKLSEALIKDLTGGDKITARFMRGEFFEFRPEFKLWLATNHKPEIRGGDPAIWRRLKLIPFLYSIPEAKQKPRDEVMKMFEAEFPGILNWALEGCLEWQAHGLGVPEEVTLATKEYRAEQDVFAAFLNEKCVCAPNAQAPSKFLYEAYKKWAIEGGETPVTHKAFSALLAERGFKKKETKNCNVYLGIGLLIDGDLRVDKQGNQGALPKVGPHSSSSLSGEVI